MKTYLGVKLVQAEPMTQRQQWAENHNGVSCCAPGEDREGYKVVYEDGYTSWSPKDVFEKAYREIQRVIPYKPGLAPHQIRVCEELSDLNLKVVKLETFINESDIYFSLPEAEKVRLVQQLHAMDYYLSILVERIENF